MVEPTKTDTDYLFQCELVDLLGRLNEINEQGKIVVLLIDELNKMGVPLDADTSSFLTENFLDKKGRYLIFSSHVQFHVDDPSGAAGVANVLTSPSGRTMKTLSLFLSAPIAVCWRICLEAAASRICRSPSLLAFRHCYLS